MFNSVRIHTKVEKYFKRLIKSFHGTVTVTVIIIITLGVLAGARPAANRPPPSAPAVLPCTCPSVAGIRSRPCLDRLLCFPIVAFRCRRRPVRRAAAPSR